MEARSAVIHERLKGVSRIVAVTGNKGGVGKTTVAGMIALMLKEEGFSVGLLDADVTSPSANILLGADYKLPEEDHGIIPPDVAGIKLMSLWYYSKDEPTPLRGKEISNVLIELLAITQWGNLDFLIVDLPPGLSDAILEFIRLINRIEFIVVGTGSPLAVPSIKKSVQVLEDMKLPILGIIENMGKTGDLRGLEADCLGALDFDLDIENAIGHPDKLKNLQIAKELRQCMKKLTGFVHGP